MENFNNYSRIKLFDYQKNIVENEQNRNSHALFMDMGTGKTIVSLALFNESEARNLLIICLPNKVDDWCEEVEKNTNLTPMMLRKSSGVAQTAVSVLLSRPNEDLQDVCVITNFQMVWRIENMLNLIDNNWFIIIDESHMIKNPKSNAAKFCLELAKRTDFKAILTGTPQSNGYIDYFAQLKFLGYLKLTLTEFKNTFCVFDINSAGGHYFQKLLGYKNTELLDRLLNEKCVFFKRDPANADIPTDIDASVEIDNKVYKNLIKDRVINFQNEEIVADTPLILRLRLRQLCSAVFKNKGKYCWLKDFFESLVNERLVIFYNFNMECDSIEELCKELKRPYSIFNAKSHDLSAFKAHENGVAICNYKSASTGLNDLAKAHVCLFFSPTESYIEFAQAKKRIDRIGQTAKPLYYYLCAKNTVEEKIYETLRNKKDFDDETFKNYIESLHKANEKRSENYA
jgi:SNF2 family DNA or RNA helicase